MTAITIDHVAIARRASERLRILTEQQDDRDGRALGRSDAAQPLRRDLHAVRGLRHHPGQPPLRRQNDPRRDGLCLARATSRARSISSMSSASRRNARPIAEEAIRIGAKVFWIQLGIVNDEAGAIAREARARVRQEPLRQDRARPLLRRPEPGRAEHRRHQRPALACMIEPIRRPDCATLLWRATRIAVVGLSPIRSRPSYGVAAVPAVGRLRDHPGQSQACRRGDPRRAGRGEGDRYRRPDRHRRSLPPGDRYAASGR